MKDCARALCAQATECDLERREARARRRELRVERVQAEDGRARLGLEVGVLGAEAGGVVEGPGIAESGQDHDEESSRDKSEQP